MNEDRSRLSLVMLAGSSNLCVPIMMRIDDDPSLEIAGVVIDTERNGPRRSVLARLRRLLRYEGVVGTVRYLCRSRRRGRGLGEAGDWVVASSSFAAERDMPVTVVDDINSVAAQNAIRGSGADIGVVIGTRILTPAVFTIPPRGMLNLHQGKVPEYRGGACTFWALYNGESELSATVHEVAASVDSGAIVLQEAIPLNYNFAKYGNRFEEFLSDVEAQLDELGVDLMARALHELAAGGITPRQVDTSAGRRWRKPTFRQKRQLRRLLRERRQRTGSPRDDG